jgi:hypothetical protein
MTRVLRWICDPDKLEAIEGDLVELHGDHRSWRYLVDVVSLCAHQPRTVLRSLVAALVALVVLGPVAGPVHYTVHATDAAGEFMLEIHEGRAIAATLDGAHVAPHDLVQTGDTLIIRGGDHGADFYIAIRPQGGIAWYPRHSSSR